MGAHGEDHAGGGAGERAGDGGGVDVTAPT